MKNITQKLTKLMDNFNLSQADLAKMANVSEASVSAWMRGAVPRRRYLLKIADALNIDIVSLEDDSMDIQERQRMPMAKGPSILDAYVSVSEYDILAGLSDLIDKLDETDNEKEGIKQVIDEMVLSLIRGINTLSGYADGYALHIDKTGSVKEPLTKLSDKMLVLSYALGQCARSIPAENLKRIIQNIRRYSELTKKD